MNIHEGESRMMTLGRHLDVISSRRDIALDSALLGWWDWDIVTDSLWWSANMFRLYDVDPDMWPQNGRDGWSRFIIPEDREKTVARLLDACENPSVIYNIVFRVCTPNKEIRIILATGRVMRDADGKAVRMVGINMLIPHTLASEMADSLVTMIDHGS